MMQKLQTLAEPLEDPGEQFLRDHLGTHLNPINEASKPRAVSLLNTQSIKKNKSDMLQPDLNASEGKGSEKPD